MSESRKRLSLCLCFLFLGILIGISFDAEFRPNHLLFWVNVGQDLSLRFQPGDTIEWKQLSNNKPMNITFPGSMPCVGGITNPCVIDNIPKTATYYYTCTGAVDASFVCNDPQGGPVSVTGEQLYPGFFTKIFDLIHNVLAPVSRIFGHSAHTSTPEVTQNTPGATQNMADNIATGQAKIVSANASPSATKSNIYAQLSCNLAGQVQDNVTHVNIYGQPVDNPIHASVHQNILWGTSSANGFTITMPVPSTCTQNVSTFGPNGMCTVAMAGSFTALAPPCTVSTAESIAVP